MLRLDKNELAIILGALSYQTQALEKLLTGEKKLVEQRKYIIKKLRNELDLIEEKENNKNYEIKF